MSRIEEYKTEINLANYILDNYPGWKASRVTMKEIELKGPDKQKVSINRLKHNNHYVFNVWSGAVGNGNRSGGSIIDFVAMSDNYNPKSKEGVSHAASKIESATHQLQPHYKGEFTHITQMTDERENGNRNFLEVIAPSETNPMGVRVMEFSNYGYFHNRGITTETLESKPFKGAFVDINRPLSKFKHYRNVGIPMRDLDGFVVGMSERFGKSKKNVGDSYAKGSFWISNRDTSRAVDRVMVFEGAPDALAWHQMNKPKENIVYVAYHGGKVDKNKVQMLNELVYDRFKAKEISFGLDGNTAGLSHYFDARSYLKGEGAESWFQRHPAFEKAEFRGTSTNKNDQNGHNASFTVSISDQDPTTLKKDTQFVLDYFKALNSEVSIEGESVYNISKSSLGSDDSIVKVTFKNYPEHWSDMNEFVDTIKPFRNVWAESPSEGYKDFNDELIHNWWKDHKIDLTQEGKRIPVEQRELPNPHDLPRNADYINVTNNYLSPKGVNEVVDYLENKGFMIQDTTTSVAVAHEAIKDNRPEIAIAIAQMNHVHRDAVVDSPNTEAMMSMNAKYGVSMNFRDWMSKIEKAAAQSRGINIYKEFNINPEYAKDVIKEHYSNKGINQKTEETNRGIKF